VVRAVAGGKDRHSKVAAASTTASPTDLASPRRRPSSLPLHGADRHGADPRRRPSPSLLVAAAVGASTTATVTRDPRQHLLWRGSTAARCVEVGTTLPSLSLFLHLPLPLPLQMTTMRSGHHGLDPAPTALTWSLFVSLALLSSSPSLCPLPFPRSRAGTDVGAAVAAHADAWRPPPFWPHLRQRRCRGGRSWIQGRRWRR